MTQGTQGVWQIKAVGVSEYDQNRAIPSSIAIPSWQEVRDVILSLNAGRRSDMSIESADGSLMTIGGGAGRFIVGTQNGPDSQAVVAATLMDSARGGDEEEVIIGGGATFMPALYIVDEDKVLRAAERFYQDGSLDPSLEWELL